MNRREDLPAREEQRAETSDDHEARVRSALDALLLLADSLDELGRELEGVEPALGPQRW